MDPSVVAAWIAAATAVAGTVATVWTSHETLVRQQAFEQSVHAAQQAFERQQVRFSDRRDAYRSFLVAAESLMDTLNRYVRPGDISRYEVALAVAAAVREHDPEAAAGLGTAGNPLPALAPGSREAGRLEELIGQARTQRVLITLTGPDSVVESALAFERSARLSAGAVLARDAPEARRHFEAAAGARESFLRQAAAVLGADDV